MKTYTRVTLWYDHQAARDGVAPYCVGLEDEHSGMAENTQSCHWEHVKAWRAAVSLAKVYQLPVVDDAAR